MRQSSILAFRPTMIVLSAIGLLSSTGLPVFAQDSSKDDHTPAHHTRLTMEEHFAQANSAHDGHLTLDEAKAGYPIVARHFREIDTDAKGYVTQNDLRAWHALQKAAHRPQREATDSIRPRNAFQLAYPGHQPLNTSTNHTVAMPTDASPEPATPAEPH